MVAPHGRLVGVLLDKGAVVWRVVEGLVVVMEELGVSKKQSVVVEAGSVMTMVEAWRCNVRVGWKEWKLIAYRLSDCIFRNNCTCLQEISDYV